MFFSQSINVSFVVGGSKHDPCREQKKVCSPYVAHQQATETSPYFKKYLFKIVTMATIFY